MAHTEAELLDNPVAGRPTLILRSPDFHSITEVVAEPLERPTPLGWWLFFLPSLGLLGLLGVAVSWLFWEGIGVWGLNSRSAGPGTSRTSCSGSASATPAR